MAKSEPISGEHHDHYNIEKSMSIILKTLREAHIYVDGLFLNADAGFDSKGFRKECKDRGIFPNVCFNKKNKEHDDDDYADELLLRERYSIERTNA